ncbi:MAG: hypothetical protein J6D52_06465 [Clostridia bacterium]|nr:hypothetical protein [Clostridia bacterium]
MAETTKNNEIYIVISQTGTLLSRILKGITHKAYNHASITPYSDLHIMYSFGRKNPYNPFWAGFVTESAEWGTFKRFSKAEVIVISIGIQEQTYANICSTLNTMLEDPKSYKYNYWGLWLAAFRIAVTGKNRYYCSEFVREILKLHSVNGSDKLQKIVHPMHFLSMPNVTTIYKGKLKDFNREPIEV